MKYSYAYKTSDGQRHEDAMEAPSREAVFATLRAQGIKAIKVVAADGSKANGEVRGVRKRVVTLLALGLILCAIIAAVLSFRAGETASAAHAPNHVLAPDALAPRHQIYGDPAVMSSFEQGDFADVFDEPGDQLLAWFAQPGKLMCPPKADAARCTDQMAAHLLAIANKQPAQLTIGADDTREVVELKQIVNGLRAELRAYLANGNGTPQSYWRRLNERLTEEQQIYLRTQRELEDDPSPTLRAERNAALRAMGLRTIPAPSPSAD